MTDWHREVGFPTAVISLTIIGMYFLVSVLLYIEIHLQDPADFHYWLEVITGNWSASSPPYDVKSVAFSLSVTIALLLNLGSFGLLIKIFTRFRNLKMEQAMKLQELYKVRDMSIINSIVKLFPSEQGEDIRGIIKEGFKNGNEVWARDHLNTIFGEEEAAKMRNLLRETHLGGENPEPS